MAAGGGDKGFALQRTRLFDNFGIVKRGREAVRRADWHPLRPACQPRKGGGNMGGGIGTDGAVCGLESAEKALFGALIRELGARDYDSAVRCVDMLERLSLV